MYEYRQPEWLPIPRIVADPSWRGARDQRKCTRSCESAKENPPFTGIVWLVILDPWSPRYGAGSAARHTAALLER
ncbi:MAG: hypothetical protein ACXWD5_07160 [Mycobacterium sp.]